MSLYLEAMSADGGTSIRAALAGGEVDPSLEPLRRVASLPAALRQVAARTARALGQPSLTLLLEAVGEKSVDQLWRITEQLRGYRAVLLEEMDRQGLDALVCPAYATPAFVHGGSKGFTLASSYSILFNVTQLPAGVVPVTRVRPEETTRSPGRDRLVQQAVEVDAKSDGLPVGVQVVGRAWRDHLVLALMQAIEADVSREEDYPKTPVDPIG
jgi:fatty acid amide hydrolase